MIVKLLILAILSVMAGIFDRAGGSGNYSRLWRILGVPICQVASLALFWHPNTILGWSMLVLTLGLLMGAISTYRLFFPKPKDGNYGGFTFGFYGFAQGLAMGLLIMAGLHWYLILGRAILLGILLGVWFNNFNIKIGLWQSDIVQEFFRGLVICLTVPLILI